MVGVPPQMILAVQPENAYPPMLVTPFPRVTEVSPVQPENARLPMLVVLKVTRWIIVQFSNAFAGISAVPITVTSCRVAGT